MHPSLPAEDIELVLSLTPEFWLRYANTRVFVTGGTGFIGTWLLEVIQRANDVLGSRIEMVVLSRDPQRALRNWPHIFARSDTSLIAGEITHFKNPVGKFDLCIHAATDVSNPLKSGAPVNMFNSIIDGTRRVLDLAQTSGASRLLLTSSGAVYGSQPVSLERIDECYLGAPDPLQLSSAYGNGKRASEWLTVASSMPAVPACFSASIARIFAILGPGLPFNGAFAAGNFIRDALAGKQIEIQGNGRPLRSYLYIADVCVWLLRILSSGASGQAYNVGSENSISIAELAQQVVLASGRQSEVRILNPDVFDAPVPRYVPDTHKARQELGLAEYTPLAAALQKTFHWSRSSATL